MLSYFKSQQPTAIAFFILLFVLLKLPFLVMHPVSVMLPVAGWFHSGIWLVNYPAASFFLAQLCLLLQAVWFNYLFHQADYHESNTMVPAVYFVLFTSILPAFNYISLYHVLAFLFLLMFRVLLQINSMESARSESYNAGFITGVLVLLFPGILLFIPFLLLILYVLKSFRIQEFVLMPLGVITPLYMAWGIGYLLDINWQPGGFWNELFYPFYWEQNVLNTIILIVSGAYLLISFISLRGILFSVGFKRRKNVNMIVWFFLGMCAVVLGNGKLGLPVLSVLWLPVSVFLSLLILRARRKRMPEILHVVFVLTIFIINIVRMLQ